MAPVVFIMFDIFKGEAGEWGPTKTIECDEFAIHYTRFRYNIEISFCTANGAVSEQFAFLIHNIYSERSSYWCYSAKPPKSSCSYSEFFDWMLENKPNVAEWLLFNAI